MTPGYNRWCRKGWKNWKLLEMVRSPASIRHLLNDSCGFILILSFIRTVAVKLWNLFNCGRFASELGLSIIIFLQNYCCVLISSLIAFIFFFCTVVDVSVLLDDLSSAWFYSLFHWQNQIQMNNLKTIFGYVMPR